MSVQLSKGVQANIKKDLMLSYGIPYDDIDIEMRELVYLLNFHLGIKTKYCCIGERDNEYSYIMFDESVTDEQVLNLQIILDEINLNREKFVKDRFDFNKWLRKIPKSKNPEYKMNWIWRFNKNKKIEYKIKFVNKICKVIEEYEE